LEGGCIIDLPIEPVSNDLADTLICITGGWTAFALAEVKKEQEL